MFFIDKFYMQYYSCLHFMYLFSQISVSTVGILLAFSNQLTVDSFTEKCCLTVCDSLSIDICVVLFATGENDRISSTYVFSFCFETISSLS
jgi:hypothetical protein